MELSTIKRQTAKGSAIGALRIGLAIPIYLVLTPFLLDKLGPELFGLWSLSTAILGLLNLTDFGLKNSLVFYMAKEIQNEDIVNRYFNTTFWTYLVVSLAICIASIFLESFILKQVFSVPTRFSAEASFVLLITLISFVARLTAIPYQAALEAHQELYISQLLFIGWLLINFLGTLIALTVSANIYSLGVASLISNLLLPLGFYGCVRVRFPSITLQVSNITYSQFRDLFRYGAGIQVASVVVALREPMYKILLARSYDLSAVASFEIAYKLCSQAMSVIATPLLGFLGASALLHNRKDDLDRLLRPLWGYSIGAVLPLALFVGSFSSRLTDFWLGAQSLNVEQLLPPIFTGFALYYSTELLYKALQGMGCSSYSAVIQALVMFTHFAVFQLFKSQQHLAVPLSLIAGFLLFSASNYVTFRTRYRICLMDVRQTFWLFAPSLSYVLIWWVSPEQFLPPAFVVYAVVHIVFLRKANIFDFFSSAKALIYWRENATSP